jgi:hypothetical protein
MEDGHSPQAVYRAQGEKEQTFAPAAAPTQQTGIEDLQKEAQKAVEEEFGHQGNHNNTSCPACPKEPKIMRKINLEKFEKGVDIFV